MSDYTGNYNNGADVTPIDVEYMQAEGGQWSAYLGFIHYPTMIRHNPKYYVGVGATREESLRSLVDAMKAHLERLV